MCKYLEHPFIFLLVITTHNVHGQSRISREVFHAYVAKTINFSQIIPTTDPNFVPNYKEVEGEEELEEALVNNIRNRARTTKIKNRFDPEIATPIISNPQSRTFNHSPCFGFRGLFMGAQRPPDVAGAVGFNHVILSENDSMRILNRYGTQSLKIHQQDPGSVWAGLYSGFVFDPKIVYDPYENRWVQVILADPYLSSSVLLIAVSDSPDPMGMWNVWSFDADLDNNQWLDYPSIGFNQHWFVVNGLAFPVSGSSPDTESRTFVFPKAQLYYGNPIDYSVFNVTGYGQITPAFTFDNSLGDLWCVTNDDVDDNDLRFFKISGPLFSPAMTEEGFISIGEDWGNNGGDLGPQLGSPVRINTGDHKVLSVVWRNGKLYTAQTVFLPDGGEPTTSTIQMVVCNPVSESVIESTRFSSDANSMYAFPNLAVNAEEDIVISCATFVSTSYPGASVLVREHGTVEWVQTEYKNGEDYYVNIVQVPPPRNRWGDYSTAVVDPSDDKNIWVMGEYARPKASPTNGQWGIWIAKICAGTCFPEVTMNTNQPPNTYKKFEASNIVTANKEIAAGAFIKLDGGSAIILQHGFKAHIGCNLQTVLEGCNGPQ